MPQPENDPIRALVDGVLSDREATAVESDVAVASGVRLVALTHRTLLIEGMEPATAYLLTRDVLLRVFFNPPQD